MVSARFALLSALASSAVASAGLAAREETSTTIETVYITITRTIHGYTGTPYTEYVTGCDTESSLPEVTSTTDFTYPTESTYPSELPTELPTDVIEAQYNSTVLITVPCSETPTPTPSAGFSTILQYNGTTLKQSVHVPSETPSGYTGSASVLKTGPMAALVGFLGAVVFML